MHDISMRQQRCCIEKNAWSLGNFHRTYCLGNVVKLTQILTKTFLSVTNPTLLGYKTQSQGVRAQDKLIFDEKSRCVFCPSTTGLRACLFYRKTPQVISRKMRIEKVNCSRENILCLRKINCK